ncbi:hypothetical protein J5X98_25215 [Leptothermofonsia sichuanensis E412]|uniref:hypothetical protein n=1 Tax=Leptothermofonsia sichuanensis TaxID=2917832 RepID=UPI001CA6A65C|nr:hypothetical protein [Leptothermofonsia sichuanensis]QZZ20494.1 hypothetical protein J5X98_25215 [Leptothermofonsia sichuanensis E412]
MSASESPSAQTTARFRSATEFPRTVVHLSASEANQLYVEMRDCLIFTNRSRSQLIRRNQEHKQTALALKADVARLQQLINQTQADKQVLVQNQQQVIAELERELRTMTTHLDQLSRAFEDVEEVHNAMGVMAIPGRFANFWRALRALILWWRDEYSEVTTIPPETLPASSQISPGEETDRQENPQMYTDPASIQRSLRDQ